ncbi:hypothetical protein PsYK624_123150 [Phanerochaete sordida]|uniref:Uncharacterized protein n=1 Tax=Phanerochaete sordida TaxID=48140 RepID=A0A9P3GJ55_9APHY|nr:hypothetical protein PsYK624_123150 [Phanerochaete sordida]
MTGNFRTGESKCGAMRAQSRRSRRSRPWYSHEVQQLWQCAMTSETMLSAGSYTGYCTHRPSKLWNDLRGCVHNRGEHRRFILRSSCMLNLSCITPCYYTSNVILL